LAGAHVLVADASDGLSALDVTGSGARDLLASACGLDLHPRAFPPDRVARTLAAGVDVVLYRTENQDGFRLHVARPVAAHLWDWLAAAAGDAMDIGRV
ncbi:MAG: sarcosine oxidase subunit gamma family protein, partial [Alphaproteobacteria bacterium]